MTISPEGGRILGCLVEKQLTTPQQYPLTMNALSLACSQATNRDPVMSMGEDAVQGALAELKELHLVRFVLPSHGRSVIRYRHVLDEAHGLDTLRVALLAVLLLRGPQTSGELRARTGRMAEFDTVGDVHAELEVLAALPEPLVRLLPRRPGQKEERWQQLLAVEPEATVTGHPDPAVPPVAGEAGDHRVPDLVTAGRGPTVTSGDEEEEGRPDLETRVDTVESELAALRERVVGLVEALDALRHSLGE